MKKYSVIYIIFMLYAFLAGGSMGSISGNGRAAFLNLIFLAVLILAGCQDIREMKIGDHWHVLFLGLALVSCLFVREPGLFSRAAGFFCVSAPLFVTALLVAGGIGGGDIKLTAGCGLFLGWRAAAVAGAAGIVLGGCFSLCMLAVGKLGRKEPFPLGPFLCMGMAFGIYGGEPMFERLFCLR